MQDGRKKLIEDFIESYQTTTHQLVGVVRDGMKDCTDLHPGMYAILKILSQSGTAFQADIAARLNHTDAAISRQVALMRDRGFVTVEQDANNRRKQQVSLTAKGEEILNDAMESVCQQLSAALEGVPDELLKNMIKTNDDLRKAMTK